METKKNDKKLKKEIMKKAPIICGSIVAFLLLLGVLLFVFEANEEITQFTIKNEKLYTYSLYHRMDFYTEVTLDHEENVTKLLYNGEEFTLFTEPIYYAEKDLAVFPNRMSVVFPLEGKKQRKINRYTKVDGRGEQIVISNNNMKYALTDSFIYDGGDVYVFTEDGIVKYGDKEIPISKMSMLVCEYRGALAIYDYKTKEMYYEEKVTDTVMVDFVDYKVNVSVDTIVVNDEPSLLDKNVENQAVLKS